MPPPPSPPAPDPILIARPHGKILRLLQRIAAAAAMAERQ